MSVINDVAMRVRLNEKHNKILIDAGFHKTQVDAILEVASSIATTIASTKMLEVANAARMGPR